MTTYTTTHDGLERMIWAAGAVTRAAREFGRDIAAAWRAIDEARAQARARAVVAYLARHDQRMADDLRAMLAAVDRSGCR